MGAVSDTHLKLVALCKSRGFVYPGSEIYGGLANAWDYGPLGVELKNNIKQAWWKKFVRQSPYNVGLDSAILRLSLIHILCASYHLPIHDSGGHQEV